MPDEPTTNPPTESSISANASMDGTTPSPTPPAPVAPAETSTSAKATADVPPPPTPESPTPPLASSGAIRSLLSKALAKIRFRKQAKLEKIMVLAKSKGQVTNDDVQKLLRVSDATAGPVESR